jgi:hypothetical protein
MKVPDWDIEERKAMDSMESCAVMTSYQVGNMLLDTTNVVKAAVEGVMPRSKSRSRFAAADRMILGQRKAQKQFEELETDIGGRHRPVGITKPLQTDYDRNTRMTYRVVGEESGHEQRPDSPST